MSCAIPGGCLCCTGEEDFQQQLGKLVRERPARILIEPSGIAHPGAVIDELRAYERAGLLRLMSTIALVDVPRLGVLQSGQRTTEREQVEAADVVLLSKAELASPLDRERFWSAARDLFPAKRWIGLSSAGVLPPEALQPPQAAHSFELVAGQPAVHSTEHVHSHAKISAREFTRGAHVIQSRTQSLLGREACGWSIPAEAIFAKQRLVELQRSPLLNGVERLKAVLRTGVEQRLLAQCHLAQFSLGEITWGQESRIEIQMRPGGKTDWPAWDRFWLSSME